MLLMVVIIKCHPAFKMLLRVMKQSEFNTHLYMTYISKQDHEREGWLFSLKKETQCLSQLMHMLAR